MLSIASIVFIIVDVFYLSLLFNNCALIATIIVLRLINTAHIVGLIRIPVLINTPAASGITATL